MNAIIEAKKKVLSRQVGSEFHDWWTVDYALGCASEFERFTSICPVTDPAYHYYNDRRNEWLNIAILIEEIQNNS